MSRRVLSALALAAVLGAGTGCGVTGTDFRPGVAAQVGDDRVYTDEVDDAADKACDYFTDRESGEAFPKSQLRGELLQLVVQQAAIEQLLDDSDVAAPAVQESSIDDFVDQQFAGATERQADGLGTGAEAVLVVQSGLTALGTALLTEEGTPVDPTQPDAAVQRGFDELSTWMLDHDVELNPVYGITIDDAGQLTAESDDTSVVVSDEARFGGLPDPAAEPDEERQAYVDDLPASQTCG